MTLDEALRICGEDMLRLERRTEEYRASAQAYNEHLWDAKTRHAFDFLSQRADEFLRLAARREQSAQALQMVIEAARTVAAMETTDGHVST